MQSPKGEPGERDIYKKKETSEALGELYISGYPCFLAAATCNPHRHSRHFMFRYSYI
jgi:hypothetical protein